MPRFRTSAFILSDVLANDSQTAVIGISRGRLFVEDIVSLKSMDRRRLRLDRRSSVRRRKRWAELRCRKSAPSPSPAKESR